MLSYTDKDIKDILTTIITDVEFTIIPVGNHDIGRHLVYKVVIEGESRYIFKIYYITKRRIREIESLELLRKSNITVPKVVKYGESNSDEWILMEYIDGELLEKMYAHLDMDNKLLLFTQMGEELGKIHSFQKFEFIGDWNNKIRLDKYGDYTISKIENSIEEIMNQDLPDIELLMKGIKILRDNYGFLYNIKESRLTHGDFDGRNILVTNINNKYKISAIIDFELCYPQNCENDLANLYFKYFLDNKEYEKAFLNGYNQYMAVHSEFYEKLKFYLIHSVIDNCSWSYLRANDYYTKNINFLKRLL